MDHIMKAKTRFSFLNLKMIINEKPNLLTLYSLFLFNHLSWFNERLIGLFGVILSVVDLVEHVSSCCWLLYPGGGALPKNMWRVCAATLTPIFKPPVTEWLPFFFTFCSHLMTSIFKMLSHLTGGNCSFCHGKNEKEYSWHIPAMKFIGMKQLV